MKPSALLPSDRPDVCLLAPPAANVAHGIVSQAVLTAPGLRVTLFRFAAGQELSEHTSTARVLVQVLSGACDFMAAGHSHALRAGPLLHLPLGVIHSVKATEEVKMLLTQESDASP